MWNDNPTGCNKASWFTEPCGISYVIPKVVSEISTVRQVKCLEQHIQFSALLDLEGLANSGIQLKERLAAQIPKRQDGALPGPQAVSIEACGTAKSVRGSE